MAIKIGTDIRNTKLKNTLFKNKEVKYAYFSLKE